MKCYIGIIGVVLATVLVNCGDPEPSAEAKKKEMAEWLNKVFEKTSNWQVVTPADTSYMYFSQSQPGEWKVYHYNMINGDSVNSSPSQIKTVQDKTTWNLGGADYVLDSARAGSLYWHDQAQSNATMDINRVDSMHITVFLSNTQVSTFNKLEPLSVFLAQQKEAYKNQ